MGLLNLKIKKGSVEVGRLTSMIRIVAIEFACNLLEHVFIAVKSADSNGTTLHLKAADKTQ